MLLHTPAADDTITSRGSRIRCPKCGWEPGRDDLWACECGCVWNTFLTRGVCPGCGRAWRETQCRRCGEWSRHDDWYVEEDAR